MSCNSYTFGSAGYNGRSKPAFSRTDFSFDVFPLILVFAIADVILDSYGAIIDWGLGGKGGPVCDMADGKGGRGFDWIGRGGGNGGGESKSDTDPEDVVGFFFFLNLVTLKPF